MCIHIDVGNKAWSWVRNFDTGTFWKASIWKIESEMVALLIG